MYILISSIINIEESALTIVPCGTYTWHKEVLVSAKGLGKGLGALISIFEDEGEVALTKETSKTTSTTSVKAAATSVASSVKKIESLGLVIQELDIGLIDNNINQPRKDFDPEQLQELADSIKANGIFQPILVTEAGKRFMIVAGERRWRAAKLAGLKTVPAVVRNYNARQISEIAIIENLQREDLNVIDLAQGIKRLMDEFFLTQEKVAIALGKNRSSIANVLRLLNLPKEVQQMIRSGTLSPGHAKVLVVVSNPTKCQSLADKCVKEGISVRQLEELLKTGETPPRFSSGGSSAPRTHSLELRQLERDLTQSLGTKILIQGNSHRGRIVIEYFDEIDLKRLIGKFR